MTADFDESLLDQYDDSTLGEYILNAPRTTTIGGIYLLSPNLISKPSGLNLQNDAIKAMDLAGHLGIRVPAIRRVLHLEGKLALQLRRWVRKMRSLTSSTARGLHTGQFNSIWVEDLYRIPDNASPATVRSYFEFWGNFIIPPRGQIPKRPDKLKVNFSSTLFFTHQDLAPRNMMIDKENRLWILDWHLSGWYPEYLEYCGMQNFDAPSSWNIFDCIRWRLFSWFSVGSYEVERKAVQWGLSRSVEF